MKRIINVAVRSSICNFRCSYCYLNQKKVWFKNEQINYRYSPEIVKKAFSIERLGGPCWFNICADGETLLAKDILEYTKVILENGHYVEFVSNMTVTKVLQDFCKMNGELLKRVEFKCSFHYAELKQRGLLNVFADNVNLVRKSGCSICVEMIPDDNMIPFIEEIKDFSIEHFGALPQLSIPRNDKKRHDLLSKLSMPEFVRTWRQFDSPFFDFKLLIFKKKIRSFCHAGRTALYVDLATGHTQQCYNDSGYSFNIFENIDSPIPFCSICKCNDYYCYNGHLFLTTGCTNLYSEYHYGDIRDRQTIDNKSWISNDVLRFMNEKSYDCYTKDSDMADKKIMRKKRINHFWKAIRKRLTNEK